MTEKTDTSDEEYVITNGIISTVDIRSEPSID